LGSEVPPYWRGRAEEKELPRLVAECEARWSLELEPPFAGQNTSYVAPARLRDGREAVLKINLPDRETEHEATALAHWDGDGATRVYEYDEPRRALLLERLRPGTQLWELPEEEALPIAAAVAGRLASRPAPAGVFQRLEDEAARWADELPGDWERAGRPFEQSLLDEALAVFRELGPTQGEQVVVNQDFHGGNVLASERGWLAIDPKPLAGEREFGLVSFVRDRRPCNAATL
jgi:streptomycin 6-kinase